MPDDVKRLDQKHITSSSCIFSPLHLLFSTRRQINEMNRMQGYEARRKSQKKIIHNKFKRMTELINIQPARCPKIMVGCYIKKKKKNTALH
jgi:hypothetical protein